MRPRVLVRTIRLLAASVPALVWASACQSDVEVGADVADGLGSGGSFGFGGSPAAAGAAGSDVIDPPCEPVLCAGKLRDCGDCADNDRDGLVDARDPECLGWCDDSEKSFSASVHEASNRNCNRDCYFDQNGGPGNDMCFWNRSCDEAAAPAVGCPFDRDVTISGTDSSCNELERTQDPICLNTCLPLTPNGCDCFGCCELPAGSGSYVLIGSISDSEDGCTRDTLTDPTRCSPCKPVPSCFNACEECELCVGKVTMPDQCNAAQNCAPGDPPCGRAGQPSCEPGRYCVTGCCVRIPE